MVEFANELGFSLSAYEISQNFAGGIVELPDGDLEKVSGGRNRGDRRDTGDTGWSETWRIMKYCIVHPFGSAEQSLKGERLPEISGTEVVDEIIKSSLF